MRMEQPYFLDDEQRDLIIDILYDMIEYQDEDTTLMIEEIIKTLGKNEETKWNLEINLELLLYWLL